MSGGTIAINRKRSGYDRDYFDYWKRLLRLIEIRPINESDIAIIPFDYSIIGPGTRRLINIITSLKVSILLLDFIIFHIYKYI